MLDQGFYLCYIFYIKISKCIEKYITEVCYFLIYYKKTKFKYRDNKG